MRVITRCLQLAMCRNSWEQQDANPPETAMVKGIIYRASAG
jgi:hypothetical protein